MLLLVVAAVAALCCFVALLACLAVTGETDEQYADPEWRRQVRSAKPDGRGAA